MLSMLLVIVNYNCHFFLFQCLKLAFQFFVHFCFVRYAILQLAYDNVTTIHLLPARYITSSVFSMKYLVFG